MMRLVLAVVCLVAACSASRIIGEPGNGDRIPLDVSIGDGYIITVSGHPNTVLPAFRQSISLYDFDVQLEARKVIEEDTCYIRRIHTPFKKAVSIIGKVQRSSSKSTTLVTEDRNQPGEEIPEDKVEETVGPRIHDFCSGYTVVWLEENRNGPIVHGRGKRQTSLDFKINYNQFKGLSVSLGVSIRF